MFDKGMSFSSSLSGFLSILWKCSRTSFQAANPWSANGTKQSAATSRHVGGMGAVRITSLIPKFNGSHFGLPPSSIHRMTGWVANSRILWLYICARPPFVLTMQPVQACLQDLAHPPSRTHCKSCLVNVKIMQDLADAMTTTECMLVLTTRKF